jgi:hypothetical protein
MKLNTRMKNASKVSLPLFAAPLLATLLFASSADLLAQAPGAGGDATGVSHPELLNDDIDAVPAAQHYQKPSPAVPAPMPTSQPAAPAAQSAETYTDTYVPYTPTLQARTNAQTAAVGDRYAPHARAVFDPNDVNSGVITSVASGPNELPIGTRITAQLNETISTRVTPAGTRFAAVLPTDILRAGHTLLPAGTIIRGRITQSHGGRRISGASAIRLQPDEIILPDRSIYRLNAEVVDLDHFKGSHVNREGTITNNGSGKATAAILGGTTATATIAGAVIGGGVGAVVGAGIGAGVGTVWWLRQDHQQTLPQGTEIVFGLNEPLVIAPSN